MKKKKTEKKASQMPAGWAELEALEPGIVQTIRKLLQHYLSEMENAEAAREKWKKEEEKNAKKRGGPGVVHIPSPPMHLGPGMIFEDHAAAALDHYMSAARHAFELPHHQGTIADDVMGYALRKADEIIKGLEKGSSTAPAGIEDLADVLPVAGPSTRVDDLE